MAQSFPWYQAPATGVYHRGGLCRGTANTSCGINFIPQSRRQVSELTAQQRCQHCWTINQMPG